jgi:hypothetical protein
MIRGESEPYHLVHPLDCMTCAALVTHRLVMPIMALAPRDKLDEAQEGG